MAKMAAHKGLFVKHQVNKSKDKSGKVVKTYEYYYIYKSVQNERGKGTNVGPLGNAAIDPDTGVPFIDPLDPDKKKFLPRFEDEDHIAYIYYDIDQKSWIPVETPSNEAMKELKERALKKNGEVIEDMNLSKSKKQIEDVRGEGKIVNLRPVSGPQDVPSFYADPEEVREEIRRGVDRQVKKKFPKLEKREKDLLGQEKSLANRIGQVDQKEDRIKKADRRSKEEIVGLYVDLSKNLGLTGVDKVVPSDAGKPKTFAGKRRKIDQMMKDLVETSEADRIAHVRSLRSVQGILTRDRSTIYGIGTHEHPIDKVVLEQWLENRSIHIESEMRRDLSQRMPDKETTIGELKHDEGAPRWYSDIQVMGEWGRKLKPWFELDRPKGTKAGKKPVEDWGTKNREAISVLFHTLPGIQDAEMYPEYPEFAKDQAMAIAAYNEATMTGATRKEIEKLRDAIPSVEGFVIDQRRMKIQSYLNKHSSLFIGETSNRDEQLLGVEV